MKMLEIQVNTKYEVDLGIENEIFLTEKESIKKVFEKALEELVKTKKTPVEAINKVMDDVRELVVHYREEKIGEEVECELQAGDAFLYINQEQEEFQFGAVIEGFRVDIHIQEVRKEEKDGYTTISKKHN